MSLVDLSHVIYPGMPKIPVLPEVERHQVKSIAQGAPMNISALLLALHIGTHVDAPVHVRDGAASIDELPIDRFSRMAVVAGVDRQPGEEITVADVLAGGPEPQPGDFLFIATGWSERFTDAGYADHPSLSRELAAWAVEQGITMVGTDTITPDLPVHRRPAGFDFPIHHTLLDSDVLITENLTNLRPVVGRRVRVHAFPLPVQGGDAGPARVVAEA
jgi:kynurenine formamidase